MTTAVGSAGLHRGPRQQHTVDLIDGQVGRSPEGGSSPAAGEPYPLIVESDRSDVNYPSEFTLHILFVCTGNICRSPIAERLTRAYAAREELDIEASSAGTRAAIASSMHPEAARVLETLGGTASDFTARQLKPRMASTANLILTMTRVHRDNVLSLAPHKLNATFTLSEASGLVTECGAEQIKDLSLLRAKLPPYARLDIEDPIGHGTDVFARVGALISQLLPPVLGLCGPRGDGVLS